MYAVFAGCHFWRFSSKTEISRFPEDNSWAVYRAAAQKQRLAPRLRAAPLFAFLLAAQSIFEFTVLQLKGECFAPPSAMICAVEMSRADSGMQKIVSKFQNCIFSLDICYFGDLWKF